MSLDPKKLDPRYVLKHRARVFPYLRYRFPRALALSYLGNKVRCELCGARLRRWATIFTADEARGSRQQCPFCGAMSRTRQLYRLILAGRSVRGLRVLHVAPERGLEARLRAAGAWVTTTDLLRDDVDLQASLTDLPVADDRFDLVLCSHVLEHIPDDRAAMRELRRVLAPGGRALVMVPLLGATTDEDPSVVDPAERTRRFGQHDHVRIYGDDIEERLKTAGFTVARRLLPDALAIGEVERARFGLERPGVVFDCA